MLDFFIALFGGAYWSYKILSAKKQKANNKIIEQEREQERERLINLYFAPSSLIDRVRRVYVQNQTSIFIDEFHDDLSYIYGENFEQDQYNPEICKNWYYSIQDSLLHLILAKDFKKMYDFLGTYSPGLTKEQVLYSRRLFKKINEYVDEPCQLTMVPIYHHQHLEWPIMCKFKPAAWNVCANYPESRMESWSNIC